MQHFVFFIFSREENVLFASRYSILVVSTKKRIGESIDRSKTLTINCLHQMIKQIKLVKLKNIKKLLPFNIQFNRNFVFVQGWTIFVAWTSLSLWTTLSRGTTMF